MTDPPSFVDHYIATRAAVIDAWAAWDEQPTNHARVHAFTNATVAYAGDSHVAFMKYIMAERREGRTREEAIHAWENDW
jgi:hypothetical protein